MPKAAESDDLVEGGCGEYIVNNRSNSMLAAFNGNSVFEGPGPLFCHHLGLVLERLDPKPPTGDAFGRTIGGSGRPKLGRTARP